MIQIVLTHCNSLITHRMSGKGSAMASCPIPPSIHLSGSNGCLFL